MDHTLIREELKLYPLSEEMQEQLLETIIGHYTPQFEEKQKLIRRLDDLLDVYDLERFAHWAVTNGYTEDSDLLYEGLPEYLKEINN